MIEKLSKEEEDHVNRIYRCKEDPLYYTIRPSGTIKFREKHKTTKEDFED